MTISSLFDHSKRIYACLTCNDGKTMTRNNSKMQLMSKGSGKFTFCSSMRKVWISSKLTHCKYIVKTCHCIIQNMTYYITHDNPFMLQTSSFIGQNNILQPLMHNYGSSFGLCPNLYFIPIINRQDVSNHNTRSSQQLNIPLFKTATGQQTFYYKIVSLWNSLGSSLKLYE